jgi:hypothetical protein
MALIKVKNIRGDLQATALEMEAGQLAGIYVTRNPEKLTKVRLN